MKKIILKIKVPIGIISDELLIEMLKEISEGAIDELEGISGEVDFVKFKIEKE